MITPYEYNRADNNFFTGGLDLLNSGLQQFDPLVTGYAFIFWVHLPEWVNGPKAPNFCQNFKALTEKNFKSLQGISDIEIDTQAYQYGFANNEYNVAAGVTKANTEITLKHQEFSGSPIKNIYQYWASGIRDPETGIATYPIDHGIDYAAANHTGELLYIVTRPDANSRTLHSDINNLEFAAYFTNVFPTRIPLAHFNYDQGDKSVVEIEIPLKCNMHISPQVDAYALEVLSRGIYKFNTEGLFDIPSKQRSYPDGDNKAVNYHTPIEDQYEFGLGGTQPTV